MNSRDLFEKYIPLSTDNFLQVPIKKLLKRFPNAEINAAISQMMEIQKILIIAQRAGTLQNIGGHVWYLNALRWLNQEMALGDFIHVPQLTTDLDSVDINTSNAFLQHISTAQVNLRNDPNYTQIVNTEQIVGAITTAKLQSESETILESTVAMVNGITEQAIQSITQSVNDGNSNIDNVQTDARSSISSHLENELNGAVSRFKAAQSLEDWGEEYDNHIGDLKTRLYGRLPSGLLAKNFKSFVLKVRNTNFLIDHGINNYPTGFNIILYPFRYSFHLLMILLRFLWLVAKNLYSLLTFILIRIRSYGFQRMFWFTLLFLLIISFVAVTLFSIYGVSVLSLPKATFEPGVNGLILKVSLFAPLTILFGLAYSFAVKNYRIYSNMLDQYEHRRTVARTSKGIILSLPADSEGDVRKTMTAAAAQALFEHRNTGHLSKKEAESTSLLEIFKVLGR